MLNDKLLHYINRLNAQGLYRHRQISSQTDMLNFSANDYLSLAHDKRVIQAYQEGYALYGSGSTSSMMVCGYSSAHKALEQTFVHQLQVDAGLLFPSGYAANLGIITLMSHIGAQLFIDKQIHASAYDGLRLSSVPFVRYLHNDVDDLNQKISASKAEPVIVTEGIFSMSGQIAPLKSMISIAQQHQAPLIVDEAHAFGVMGPEGLGAVAEVGATQSEVPLRMIPFGKALASAGAIVVGDGLWIDALTQCARSMTYSTAMSPAAAYGVQKTLEIIRHESFRRDKLQGLISHFRQNISQSPLTWRDSNTAIQQLQLGCPYLAMKLSQQLREQGILCLPMRKPTVSQQETGLRVMLNYAHTTQAVDRLFNVLHQVCDQNALQDTLPH